MTAATCIVALVTVLTCAVRLIRRGDWTWTACWLSVTLIALLVPSFRVAPPFDMRLVALAASAAAFASRWGGAAGRARLRCELKSLARPRSRSEHVWCWAIVALIFWICLGAM